MDELREQVNVFREGFEALNELLEKEQKITDVYLHNIHRVKELLEAAKTYAIENSKGDLSLRVAIQLAFQVGAKWADEHPRKHYNHETKDL